MFGQRAVRLLVAGTLGACSTGEGFVKKGYNFSQAGNIATVEVTGSELGIDAQNQVADYVSMEFLKRGYSMLERNQVQKVLSESKFQASGLTSPDGRAELGRLLNANSILSITVPKLGDIVEITAKLIDVRQGEVLWMGSASGSTKSGMSTLAGAALGVAAGAAAGHALGESSNGYPVSSGTLIGGAAGGLAGGAAGNALQPGQAEVMKSAVQKMCASLPSLVAASN